MQKKWSFSLVAAFIGLGILLWSLYAGMGNAPRPNFERSNFTITRADGASVSFNAEVARTEKEQAYGLMFITAMRDDEGMIFPFTPPKEAIFWMKNTLIPLDMLFVRSNGTIGRIVADAQPQDTTPISSLEPVYAVIEINGGLAKKNGFQVGDKVKSPTLISQ